MYQSFKQLIISYTILALLLIMIGITSKAQDNNAIPDAEERLKQLFDQILATPDDEGRIRTANHFSRLLLETLRMKESFRYTFSLLPHVSTLTPPDKIFRIYTWNVPLESGINRFYGLIQINTRGNDSIFVIELIEIAWRFLIPKMLF